VGSRIQAVYDKKQPGTQRINPGECGLESVGDKKQPGTQRMNPGERVLESVGNKKQPGPQRINPGECGLESVGDKKQPGTQRMNPGECGWNRWATSGRQWAATMYRTWISVCLAIQVPCLLQLALDFQQSPLNHVNLFFTRPFVSPAVVCPPSCPFLVPVETSPLLETRYVAFFVFIHYFNRSILFRSFAISPALGPSRLY